MGRHRGTFPQRIEPFPEGSGEKRACDEDVLKDITENLLHDLRLIDTQTNRPTRAALLLFHPDPERFVTGAYIKIGFFRDDKGNLEFQDEVHGSLMEQVDKAMDLIKTKY